MDKVYYDLRDYAMNMEVIDTHEHLPGNESLRNYNTDVLKEYFPQYTLDDFTTAGMTKPEREFSLNAENSLEDRWRILEPYWNVSRYTGYCRALELTVKGLYGIEKICSDTISEINKCFVSSLKPGTFKKVLKDVCNIRFSIIDRLYEDVSDCDRSLFRWVYHPDYYVFPRDGYDIKKVEQEAGHRVSNFKQWLEACEAQFEAAVKKEAVALKTCLAYTRTLRFEQVSYSDAEKEFNEILTQKVSCDPFHHNIRVGKAFQDFMLHYLLNEAGKYGLPVQIHTGIQAGCGNTLYNSDPEHLTNLFLTYPDIKFDIFHMGFPYQHKLSALAKMFHNVYIDMCWAHIISPVACQNALSEWLECIPVTKISAFGGDYNFVDGVYGHLLLAKENVCHVLAQKITKGLMDSDGAKIILNQLFFENPLSIFRT